MQQTQRKQPGVAALAIHEKSAAVRYLQQSFSASLYSKR
jgi:hypothetical protein